MARLKSHQLGTDVSDELVNEYETRVETTADTQGIIVTTTDPTTMATLSERCSAVVLKLNNQELKNGGSSSSAMTSGLADVNLDDNDANNGKPPRFLSHSCSTSEDENNLSFANSRTIIKP